MSEVRERPKTVALVVAAGKGRRMGVAENKQYLPLRGTPILVHTLLAFEQSPRIEQIVLVVGAMDIERCHAYKQQYGLSKLQQVVAGGRERQESVYCGLQALDPDAEYVLIHDGVRPFVSEALLDRLLAALTNEQCEAVVAAVPVKDTIKSSRTDRATTIIEQTLPRERLWAIQTPQAFRVSAIMAAHQQAIKDHVVGTDDAVLLERLQQPVHIVMGDGLNIKITTPDDLVLAEAIIQHRT